MNELMQEWRGLAKIIVVPTVCGIDTSPFIIGSLFMAQRQHHEQKK